MADSLSLSVFGNKAILDHLNAFGEEVEEKAIAKLTDAGYQALERANELTPVDTGYLQSRNQLYVNRDAQSADVTISNDTPYALFVVLGHHTRSGSWVEPNDFLTPALLEGAEWLQGELEGLLS